jgi:hypothetical protein
MSSWKASDLRGTMKEMGSTESEVSLRKRATSHFITLQQRLGSMSAPAREATDRGTERGGGS